MPRNFFTLLNNRWRQNTALCAGLDSDLSKIPSHLTGPNHKKVLKFNKSIVDTTHDLVCAYKINTAFYEALGAEGIDTMIETVKYIHATDKTIPIIADAKRADIGNTNQAYAAAIFTICDFDAVTLHPYLGKEALQSLLKYQNKGIIVLCRTSNPGAGEFQDLEVAPGKPLWLYVAEEVVDTWDTNSNCCLVVGATYPKEMHTIRKIAGDMPFLIPGIGTQGGDIKATVEAGKNSKGQGMIINSSRGIIFASNGSNYAKAARQAAIELRDEINKYI